MAITTGVSSGYYCISAPLGEDAVGEVWLARDRRLNREVTIKVHEPSASRRRLSHAGSPKVHCSSAI